MTASKAADIVYAATRDGLRLPVIDVTQPAFAVPDDRESLSRLFQASLEEERQQRRVPKFIMRWLLRSAAKRSRIVQALFSGDAAFVDGITTYVMKLGADNLPPPYDGPIDKRVASSANLTLLRLRMQQVARLVAGSVTGADESHRRRITQTRFKLIPRGLEGFAPLAARGGYRVARAETAQLSEQVLLAPA